MGDGMQWEAERPLRCPGDPPKLTIDSVAFTSVRYDRRWAYGHAAGVVPEIAPGKVEDDVQIFLYRRVMFSNSPILLFSRDFAK
jgi:hypothetical protein